MATKTTTTNIHVLLVSFPGQGHINPMLRLGRLLAGKGLHVTLATTRHVRRLVLAAEGVPDGHPVPVAGGSMRFEFFSDGFPDDEDPRRAAIGPYMSHLELAGRKSLAELIARQRDRVSCVVSNPFIPWAGDVAGELGIPCATLWVQSIAVFACYFHYHGKTLPFPGSPSVALPGLPALSRDEVPTFLNPKSPYTALGAAILSQFEKLPGLFCVLADTFRELESDAVAAMSGLCRVVPVGPLFMRAAAVEGPSSAAADEEGCLAWLDGKAAGSVVYVSFGTIVHLSQDQVDEIAHGVLSSGVSFLWVMRAPPRGLGVEPHALPEGFVAAAGERGKVVRWSPQEAVLGHAAVGCFVTHCGWNSTVEALASGVPVVALPQWGDQVTNAKFLVEVFGVGVRLGRGDSIGEHVAAGRGDVERCILEAMVGERAAEMRHNAARWKEAVAEAAAEGGSSDRNLAEFVDEIRRRSFGFGGGGGGAGELS